MKQNKSGLKIKSSIKEVKRIYEYMKANQIKSIGFMDKNFPAESEKLEILYDDRNTWVIFGDEMKEVDKNLPKIPTEKELIFEIAKMFYPSMTSWELVDDVMIGYYTETMDYNPDEKDVLKKRCRSIGKKIDGQWKLAEDMSKVLFKDDTFHMQIKEE